MMTFMDKSQIIQMHIKGMKNVDIANALGIHRNTVGKYVREYKEQVARLAKCSDAIQARDVTEEIVAEPSYDSSNRGNRKWNEEMDTFLNDVLASEEKKRRELGSNKQALTKAQIHQLMLDEGFHIGLSTVQNKINLKRRKVAETYIAQNYDFGQRFEYDFGEVKLKIGSRLRNLYLAVMVAPASDYRFAILYDNQKKQVFIDSQVRFFEHMGGCFTEGVYDNMRNVVTKFIGRNERELNEDLVKLAAYYGFAINVTNCYAGWEKGSVERSVDIVRNAAFATKWEFSTMAEAQAHLDVCLAKLNEGKDINAERASLTFYRPPYEAADIREHCRIDKYSCLFYDNNRYSVPEVLVGKEVLVKAYPNEIVAYAGGIEVARHARISGKGEMSLEILHYLGTFRRKPGAIPNSVALKSVPELKEIYDAYYTERPREFIEILRANADKGVSAATEELLACATPITNCASTMRDDAITAKTKEQIALISYTGGVLRNVS